MTRTEHRQQQRRQQRHQHRHHAPTEAEFDRMFLRWVRVAHKGQRTLGPGCLLLTPNTVAYTTLKEVDILAPELAPRLGQLLDGLEANQFIALITHDDRAALAVIDAPKPLAEWAKGRG